MLSRMILTFTTTFALLAAPAMATEFASDTLRGVQAVAIAIDGVHPDLAAYGLETDELRGMIRERVAASGVRVLSLSEAETDPDAALLELKVTIHRHTNDYFNAYPYNVSLRLKQRLELANPKAGFVSAIVWSDGRSGVEQPIYLKRLNGYVAVLVDDFLNELRSQNAG